MVVTSLKFQVSTQGNTECIFLDDVTLNASPILPA